MKYTIAIIAILAFASCKKEYTCRCVDKNGGEVHISTIKAKKKDVDMVKVSCDSKIAGKDPLLAPYTCTLD